MENEMGKTVDPHKQPWHSYRATCYIKLDNHAKREVAVIYREGSPNPDRINSPQSTTPSSELGMGKILDSLKRSMRVDDGTAQIVSIDYYVAPPVPEVDVCYSSFHGEKVNEVPVIRIYGSTPGGKKMCLHVHQVFPYLYVPCSDIPLDGDLKGDGYTHAVSLALEKALKLKAKAGVKQQHVDGCNLVRARRFMVITCQKSFSYNPHDIRRAAKLLLVDYNLYGMGHIHLLKIKFRLPLPDTFSLEKLNECIVQEDKVHAVHWQTPPAQTSTVVTGAGDQMGGSPGDSYSLTQEFIQGVQRQSTCELEGDAVVFDLRDELQQISLEQVMSLIMQLFWSLQSVELMKEAIDFLKGIFDLFDGDADGALRPVDIEDLNSTAPECPWNEAPYKDVAETTVLAGLSLDGFLSQRSLMTLLDLAKSLENIEYIEYPVDPSSAVRSSKKRRITRKKQRPFSDPYTSTTEERYAVNMVEQTVGGKRTLVYPRFIRLELEVCWLTKKHSLLATSPFLSLIAWTSLHGKGLLICLSKWPAMIHFRWLYKTLPGSARIWELSAPYLSA
ncbi:hypothetical protein MLD38_036033 [Melastoma candidum]|uniref:Uncharacterized protein n=1 Tax=Melastoma candidum TaxID=119954 RepID=A0ACB9LIG4_9MYRT|nr:hypothetical protein MLD38_036033 [Melastoma candidum]